MSNDLFSRVLTGVETSFQKAEAELEADWAALQKLPIVKQITDAEKTVLKQQLSNAFAFADTELKPHYGDAAAMVESAADTMLMGSTHGVGALAIPLTNAGISMGFQLLHAVLDRAELAAKANLKLPPPNTSAAPSVKAVVQAVAGAVETVAKT